MQLKIGQKIFIDKDVDECDGNMVFATLSEKSGLPKMVTTQIRDFPELIDQEYFEFYELEIKKVVRVKLKAQVITK